MFHNGTLVIPFGLSSHAGSRLNGRIGELRKIFRDEDRAAVSFDPRHAPSDWKRISLERLRIIPPPRAPGQGHLKSSSGQALHLKSRRCAMIIGTLLRVHERMFLSCVNKYFYNEIAPSTRTEICAHKPEEIDEEEARGRWPDHEYIPEEVNDVFLLYQIAATVLRPQRASKTVRFEPMSAHMKANTGKPCQSVHAPITFGELEYASYFRSELLAHGIDFDTFQNEWYPIAINGASCDYAASILQFVRGIAPFTVTFSRKRDVDRFFIERPWRTSWQAGPILVTPMHVAARCGDASLCELLWRLGASVNSNVQIPNDDCTRWERGGASVTLQLSAMSPFTDRLLPDNARRRRGVPNRVDGEQPSQFHWGVVTPMRLAITFAHVETVAWFRVHKGSSAIAEYTKKVRDFFDNQKHVYKSYPNLLQNSCWTSMKEDKIYFLQTANYDHPMTLQILNAPKRLNIEAHVMYNGCPILTFDEPLNPSAESPHVQVTQRVDHPDAPVVPNSSEEAALVDAMWAANVERHIQSGNTQPVPETERVDEFWSEVSPSDTSESAWEADAPHRPSDFGARIHLLSFTRTGDELRRALQEGRELEQIRTAAAERGQSCYLIKSGASIFVYPDEYASILSKINQYALKAHHVVVSEAFLPLVYKQIAQLPSRSNIKPRSLKTLALIDNDDSHAICMVERTFLNGTPHHSSESATQSTSQAHCMPNVRGRLV